MLKKTLVSIAVSLVLSLLIFVSFIQSGSTSIKSPIPDFLTILKNRQASTLQLWLPALESHASELIEPDITASSAMVFDIDSKKVIYSINPTERRPMASLTKIMTAIIALENKKSDDKYLVHKEDIVGESSIGLEPGEILSLDELLYGLILHSGNDAAETIASNHKGGRFEFIKMMNDKAKALGLKDTNFTNPSGLNGDGNQYTTAYDLLVITKYGLENPEFKKIVETVEYKISRSRNHKEYSLYNETNLLTSYPGVKGVKTGFTGEAGWCLVTYYEGNGKRLIGVILDSQSRRDEMKQLLDFSLLSLGEEPPSVL